MTTYARKGQGNIGAVADGTALDQDVAGVSDAFEIRDQRPRCNQAAPILPISKYSKQIHIPKGMEDKPSIREEFKSLIESQAGKVAEELPKPHRIVDKKAIARCRKWGKCQHTGARHTKRDPLQVAHIKSKASGGGDVDENLVLLALSVHKSADILGKPSKEEMKAMALERIRRQKISLSAFGVERLVKEQEEGK